MTDLYEFAYHSYQAGKWDQAIDAFRMHAICSPNNVHGWLGLGASLLKAGRYEEAENIFSLAKKLSLEETEKFMSSLDPETCRENCVW